MQLIFHKEIYDKVIVEQIANAEKWLWISTANIKDLYVAKGNKMVPFLELLSDLVRRKVAIRLIFAREPGPLFKSELSKYPILKNGLEWMNCPRVHFKMVVVDGKFAYTGSANLTGAGMGAKGENKRNFESGIIGTDPGFVYAIGHELDHLWMGKYCKTCLRKTYCNEWKKIL
jgi:phosphatidylserine/phosphatidylglycerophosphate/cardiolipin synthase-like enzyme